MRRVLALLAALAGVCAVPAAAGAAPPPIGHVWVVVLENTSYAESFGPDAKVPYFSRDLPAQGALLTQYYGTTHLSLGNYIAMLSGQPSNPETQSDCQLFSDFKGGAALPDGVLAGSGCVYPTSARTLPDQLEAKGLGWKGYMQDMANGPAADTCRHPAVNAQDQTQSAKVGDQYATRHDPFVYFHSIIDDQARCDQHVVDLSRLGGDLASAATTPAFSFITPNLCDDGHDEPTCVDGRPGGLVAADAFLQRTLPSIISSPAFQQDGLILVTFDEAEATGSGADSAACCNQPSGPNTPSPGGPNPGPGGGRIGALALSRYITPGTTSTVPYNHYSLLRSLEETYGIDEHLGYANQLGLATFGSDVYSNAAGTTKLPLAGMTPPVQSPPVVPTCGTSRVRGKRIGRGDLVQSVVVSDPIKRVRSVQVRMAHGARLTVSQTVGGKTRTLVRRARVRACRQYRYRLPVSRPGRLTVTASLPTGTERRTPSYR
jgi:phosphatidylinositol-3-phosphatase